MANYCHLNQYINNNPLSNNTDLDKLAREVNNNKKKRTNDIYNKYRVSQASLDHGINAYNTLHDSTLDKGTKISPVIEGFFSAQGDYSDINPPDQPTNTSYNPSDNEGTLIADIYDKKKASHKKLRNDSKKIINSRLDKSRLDNSRLDNSRLDNSNPWCETDNKRDHDLMMRMGGHIYHDNESSDSISSGMGSDSDDSSSFSSISCSTNQIDRQVKKRSKFTPKKRSKRHKCIDFDIQSVESLESLDSGESLLRHIRFCHECKDRVMDLIRKHKSDKLHRSLKKKSKAIGKQNHILTDSVTDSVTDHMVKPETNPGANPGTGSVSDHGTNPGTSSDTENPDPPAPQYKEIITLFLIGLIVIIILDLIMKS